MHIRPKPPKGKKDAIPLKNIRRAIRKANKRL